MGRPRKHTTNAARQRAYRNGKRPQDSVTLQAWKVLDTLEPGGADEAYLPRLLQIRRILKRALREIDGFIVVEKHFEADRSKL
jgi:hypothetical protein